MPHATKTLREEHTWILALLGCLEALIERQGTQGGFDAKTAGDIQALFETFVDGQHQEKEEAVLFPKLLERLQRLRDDHAEEREHLDRMRFSLLNAALGDDASRSEFASEARAYLDLQRQHVRWESLGLLPLADQLLTAEDDKEVQAGFERLEARTIERARVRERILELCERLRVPFHRDHEPARTGAVPTG